MYDWWFSKNMAITSGLLYVQKKFNGPVVKFHYLCIDILFKLSTDRSIYFASGFGFDFLIKKNDDIEHKTINRVDITFIFAVGFYLNLWKDKLFLNGEIRARAVLNPLEFVSWGKRRIATTSIEAGITFPL
jgi:hypothetical protein